MLEKENERKTIKLGNTYYWLGKKSCTGVHTSLRKKLLLYGRLYSFKQPLLKCHYSIVIAKPKKI